MSTTFLEIVRAEYHDNDRNTMERDRWRRPVSMGMVANLHGHRRQAPRQ